MKNKICIFNIFEHHKNITSITRVYFLHKCLFRHYWRNRSNDYYKATVRNSLSCNYSCPNSNWSIWPRSINSHRGNISSHQTNRARNIWNYYRGTFCSSLCSSNIVHSWPARVECRNCSASCIWGQ